MTNRYRLVLLAALLGLALSAAPAGAGVYTVVPTCGAWAKINTSTSHVATYTLCPGGWMARNVVGNFSSPRGSLGGWQFTAPGGTSISSFSLVGNAFAFKGWEARGVLVGGSTPGGFFGCPTTCSWSLADSGTFRGGGAAAIQLVVDCAAASCTNGGSFPNGQIELDRATITLADPSLPGVSGPTFTAGWKRGTPPAGVSAGDNSGIKALYLLVDGRVFRSVGFACNYGQAIPCANRAATFALATAGLSDGVHTVRAEAVDAGGNAGFGPPRTISVDNTAPTSPLDLHLAGPAGWRTANSFSVTWRNPAQAFAPIAGAVYQLCPASGRAKCVTHEVDRAGISRLDGIQVPAEGRWALSVYLIDAAGNQQPATRALVSGLNYDGSPPAGLAFLPPSPQDPAHVNVRASDPASGIASGAIEVRRAGEPFWRPLTTRVTRTGLSAFVDDEALSSGTYALRATAVDGAGLEASTQRMANGAAATLRLPLRAASRLRAGSRRRGRLLRRPLVRLGSTTVLRGRLTVPGADAAGTTLQVWRRLDLAGAAWTPLGTVRTRRGGSFVYRVHSGPAETLRFRYPGTATIRGATSDVDLRVRAASTLRPSRRLVINGEYVTFRGRLKGGFVPPGGVLVALQVYTRGQWRTFAEPRAGVNGRWSYQYRFETVSGRASFRFRASVPRQFGYPFAAGGSRTVRVNVRGL